MNDKNLKLTWVISLAVIAVASFFLAGSELFDFDLPDVLIRILGVIDLIAIPVLVWSTMKKNKDGK